MYILLKQPWPLNIWVRLKFHWQWVRLIHSFKIGNSAWVILLFAATSSQSSHFQNMQRLISCLARFLSRLLCAFFTALHTAVWASAINSTGGIRSNIQTASDTVRLVLTHLSTAFQWIYSNLNLRYGILTASNQSGTPYGKTDRAVIISRHLFSSFDSPVLNNFSVTLLVFTQKRSFPSNHNSRYFRKLEDMLSK